jgi:hypothetical protein
MNNLKKIALISVLALSSVAANAEFIKGDWETVNDNLSVIDTETGIEWLSLTETGGMSFNQVMTQLNTTFLGWRLPSADEVNQMMVSITPNVNYSSTFISGAASNNQDAYDFLDAFGVTKGGFFTKSYGKYINDNKSKYGNSDLFIAGAYTYSSGRGFYLNSTDSGMDDSTLDTGVFLVSDGGITLASINDPSINVNNANSPINQVPLPATLGLLGFAMAGLSFRRKSD